MEYRQLGRSGLRVSKIAYGNAYTHGIQVDNESAQACVHTALDAGINFFDTADAYALGEAETLLGAALAGTPRSDYVLTTKVFSPTGAGPNDRGLSRKHIFESCSKSLRRLQTDYLDLYQAHNYDHDVSLTETLRAFDDLVRQGKILYVGVSNWSAAQITDALRVADDMGLDRLISNQPPYNMLYRQIEHEIVPVCEEEGLSQIAFSPLAQGVLSGKYLPGKPPPEGSRGADAAAGQQIGVWMRRRLLNAAQRIKPIAAELGLTMSQLALAWVLAQRNVTSAIIGASRREQIIENVAACDIILDETTLRSIDDALGDDIAYSFDD